MYKFACIGIIDDESGIHQSTEQTQNSMQEMTEVVFDAKIAQKYYGMLVVTGALPFFILQCYAMNATKHTYKERGGKTKRKVNGQFVELNKI